MIAADEGAWSVEGHGVMFVLEMQSSEGKTLSRTSAWDTTARHGNSELQEMEATAELSRHEVVHELASDRPPR